MSYIIKFETNCGWDYFKGLAARRYKDGLIAGRYKEGRSYIDVLSSSIYMSGPLQEKAKIIGKLSVAEAYVRAIKASEFLSGNQINGRPILHNIKIVKLREQESHSQSRRLAMRKLADR